MITTAAAWIAAIALLAIGLLHVVWAFSPWPFESTEIFVKSVFGAKDGAWPFPAALSAVMGLVIIVAAVVPLMVNDTVPQLGPSWMRTVAIYGLAVALLGRGLGGYAMNSGSAEEFSRLNSAVYSPLCIALGLMVGVVALAN
ncbi:DUF3995 domain-containing protein [Streptomyces sp. SAJ15]|uniref:DUF3995 domain-containing protein n=1 Tax=Streptomyces sp. SAJ15 TaxID=2011095 RepID=UPI001185B398|nr:DUF3995 domain-containing protein [Streptomyces sp. SAJ15]TVL89039.1 hypothetical protein CD790_29265 [Streptomyces sp. SAJ15]